MNIQEVQAKVNQLLGQKAWGVSLGYGSFLTIEFGQPLPSNNEQQKIHGEWHLWLYNCAWRLEEGDKILAASEDERNNLEVAVHRLENLTIGRDNTDSEWGNNHIVSLPWDSNAVQQYDQVKKNTPNNYSSLTLLMQIFKNDTGKVDEWITFVKTGTLTTLFKTQANDINAGLSVSISLKDIGQLFKGKGFKDNMLQWLQNQKLFPGDLGTAIYSQLQLKNFNGIKNALASKKPVAVNTNQKIVKSGGGSGASGGEDVYGGLAGGHAYTALGTKITKTNNPNDQIPGNFYWIKVRNPWGANAYANKNNTKEAALPGFIDQGDGIFFLELSQFSTYFNSINIGATV